MSDPITLTSALIQKLKNVKLLALDVDGVLTDAGMYFSADGEALKKFNTRDGMGIRLVRDRLGIDVIWITGEVSAVVEARAKKLDITKVFFGAKDKRALLKGYCEPLGLTIADCAFMGDDRNDIDLLSHVGLAATPADGHKLCKAAAHFVSSQNGGCGCVRELCEALLEANGRADA
mgnify:CR=1 FL=1